MVATLSMGAVGGAQGKSIGVGIWYSCLSQASSVVQWMLDALYLKLVLHYLNSLWHAVVFGAFVYRKRCAYCRGS